VHENVLANIRMAFSFCDVKKTAASTRAVPTKRMKARSLRRAEAHPFMSRMRSAVADYGLDIRHFCDSYGVSQDTFTRLTGFSPRAVAHWAQGRKPSDSTARRLTELKRIFDVLEKLISPEAIGPWLKEPNPAFDGSTPLQVIERGETDRIWRMIYELESGDPA
jgi:DNA-binding transcriptional regulator YiaG